MMKRVRTDILEETEEGEEVQAMGGEAVLLAEREMIMDEEVATQTEDRTVTKTGENPIENIMDNRTVVDMIKNTTADDIKILLIEGAITMEGTTREERESGIGLPKIKRVKPKVSRFHPHHRLNRRTS
jgi:hypothetical protein